MRRRCQRSVRSPSGTGNLVAETANISDNGSVTYTVTGTLDCEATGTLVNTATVTARGDPDQNDNTATDTDTITPATCPPGGEPGSTIVVDKVVEGTQPEGTQFTISLDCVLENDPPAPKRWSSTVPGTCSPQPSAPPLPGRRARSLNRRTAGRRA